VIVSGSSNGGTLKRTGKVCFKRSTQFATRERPRLNLHECVRGASLLRIAESTRLISLHLRQRKQKPSIAFIALYFPHRGSGEDWQRGSSGQRSWPVGALTACHWTRCGSIRSHWRFTACAAASKHTRLTTGAARTARSTFGFLASCIRASAVFLLVLKPPPSVRCGLRVSLAW